ncbi:MAG TPA: hypothetical protein VHE34_14575 [Puia sp.]|uniref:lipopolysaccharide biosynthesis protein n=1 Tax=Puia sp. TaxID=2045100 RepID=UPI002BAEF190|nr:hypothetical protein [Puia sp.]HVU96450.1 hypothetical protein [Puia sp.]
MDGLTSADRQRILRGTFHSFFIQGLSMLLVFGSNAWLVRSSDPRSYGLYVHVFNWVSILSVFVMAGRDDLTLALLPRYLGAGRTDLASRLVRRCNRWLLLAAVVVSGGFLAVITLAPIPALSEYRPLFLLSSAAVYFTACLGVNQMILQAMNHIRLSQLVEKIVKPALLIAGTTAFRALSVSLDPRGLIILSTIVLAGSAILLFILLEMRLRRLAPPRPAAYPPTEGLSRKAAYFFGISLLNLLSIRIVMLMLPYFTSTGGSEAVGVFNICGRFADLLILPFWLMHTVLPQLFARHTDAERSYTRELFHQSNKLMALLCVPLMAGIVVTGKFLLSLFGAGFTMGYPALIYMSLAQALFSFFGPANTILMTQDREKQAAFCLLAYVAVLAFACRLLIPYGGVTGGALAMLAGSCFYNILLALVLWRTTRIANPFFSWLAGNGKR